MDKNLFYRKLIYLQKQEKQVILHESLYTHSHRSRPTQIAYI